MNIRKQHKGFFPIYEESIRKIESMYDCEATRRKTVAALIAVCRIANLEASIRFTRSISSIAKDMAYSYRHAAQALDHLQAVGILRIIRQSVSDSNEKAPSIYEVHQNVVTLEQCGLRLGPASENLAEPTSPKTNQAPRITSNNNSSPVSPKPASQRPHSHIHLVDVAFIAEMKAIYQPKSVDKAIADCKAWLLTPRGAGKCMTKRRLQTFLRDAEPFTTSASSTKKKYEY